MTPSPFDRLFPGGVPVTPGYPGQTHKGCGGAVAFDGAAGMTHCLKCGQEEPEEGR